MAGKTPNALGLFDMSGNASEWCFDVIYEEQRVTRGGSYFDSFDLVYIGMEGFWFPVIGDSELGFRVVRTP